MDAKRLGRGRRLATQACHADLRHRPTPRYDADLSGDVPQVSQERLARNLTEIHARIRAAQADSPHAAEHVELVVVTKSVEPTVFPALGAVGVMHVGENRVQSASRRRPLGPREWTWHGIGHLQRNKARTAIETFDVFHALDSMRLAERLEDLLAAADRRWPVYLQVNAAGDEAKGGFAPGETLEAMRRVARLPHLEVRGFMTMARQTATDADLAATFRTLREVRDEAVGLGVGGTPPTGLSMGMTDDFEIAIREGATLVRVGRAVFEGVLIPAADSSPDSDERMPAEGRRG